MTPVRDEMDKGLLAFLVLYVLAAAVVSAFQASLEFLLYAAVAGSVIGVVIWRREQLHLSPVVVAGLLLHEVLNLAGGAVSWDGIRLYDRWLVPEVFRWDHLVHLEGTFVITFVAYSLLRLRLRPEADRDGWFLLVVLVLVAMGVGALAEVVEFIGVIFLHTGPDVGGYMNNAKDLVADLAGTLLACFFLVGYDRRLVRRVRAEVVEQQAS